MKMQKKTREMVNAVEQKVLLLYNVEFLQVSPTLMYHTLPSTTHDTWSLVYQCSEREESFLTSTGTKTSIIMAEDVSEPSRSRLSVWVVG